jgi:hypothetical protein
VRNHLRLKEEARQIQRKDNQFPLLKNTKNLLF